MYTNEIKQLFGKRKMSVPNFNKLIRPFAEEERQAWREKVFITSLCHYDRKGKTFREFLDTYILSERQRYRDYMCKHTYAGENRYELADPRTFLKLVAFMESINSNALRRHLVMNMQIAFKFDPEVTIDTQCNQLIKEKINAADLWELYQQMAVND